MGTKYADHMVDVQPAWLRDPGGMDGVHAGKGDTKDSIVERIKAATTARMTTLAPADALRWIGDERGIPRGQSETDAAYAARLQHAWVSWPYAGTAFGLLNALEYAGYTVALLQYRTQAYSLDGSGNLVISSYPAASPFWMMDAGTTNWSRFDVLFLPPLPAAWRTGSWAPTFAAAAGSAAALMAVTGSPAADTRAVVVATTAGSWNAAVRFAVSLDGGTWALAQTTAQLITSLVTLGATPVSGGGAWALGDRLYVQPGFNVPADGSPEASFIKSIVAQWRPVGVVVNRYIIPTSGQVLGWPVTRQLGVADGSGQVPKLGGSTQTTWSP